MTKRVRIENADPSVQSVTVEVWSVGQLPGPMSPRQDHKQSEVTLRNPCDIAEFMVHSHQYLIVKEVM